MDNNHTDQRVLDYISEREDEIRAKYLCEKKEEALISLGFYDKVYEPHGSQSQVSVEYLWEETGGETMEQRFYRMVPIAVSDEDYENLKALEMIEDQG